MKISAAKKATFADLLVKGQTPEGAARAIGISRSTAYRWRDTDESFARAWTEAIDRKVENVDNMLYRMAMEKDLGAILAFLRAYRPETFNRKMTVAVGGDPNAPPISHEHRHAMIYPVEARRQQIEGNAEPAEPLDVPVIFPPDRKVA